MTVTNNEWQEFTSGTDTIEIQVYPGTERTQGRAFIMYNDIQDTFPGLTRLLNGKRIVGIMADSEGNRLQPLRIQYQPGCILQVVIQNLSTSSPMPSLQSSPTSPPSLPPKAPARTSAQQTPSTPSDIPKANNLSARASVLEAPNISVGAKEEYRTSVFLYDAFLQAIRNGQTEDTNIIKDDFRAHFTALEDEMAKSADLQQQMMEMQQSMVHMQQQALDRLALVQTRIQAILVQNYELHEYPIPRLFIVLPNDPDRWDPSRLFQNKFRLYFLCECGEHTRPSQSNNSSNNINATSNYSNGNNIPHHIHLARHEGYDIETPTEFFRQYGSYILDMLNMLKYGAMVAGLTVPALVPLRMTATIDQLKDSLNHFSYNIEPSVNQAITYLQALSVAQNPQRGKKAQEGKGYNHADELEALEGADLRRLGTFLKNRDSFHVLGNLYRIVTTEGHVKWVCLDHYRSSYNTAAVKELTDIVQVNGGLFEEHTGQVEISLSSSIIAGQFYRAMERGRAIQELRVTLAWETTLNDLKAFRDAVHRSNLFYLDLSFITPPSMTSFLGRLKASNPLWEMMVNARLHTFVLAGFNGFFSDTSFSLRMTELRRLNITDQVNWKKDGARLLDLIKYSPMLYEMSIETTDLPEAYVAIKKAFGATSPLKKLSLQSGALNCISACYEEGALSSVDLWVSDLSSPLLKGITNLRILQIRTEIHLPIGSHLSTLTDVVLKNPGLRELWIRCHLQELGNVFETVRAVAATMGSMTSLQVLRVYRGHIQLSTMAPRDSAATTLEIMSSELSSTPLLTLLKAYGNRLKKFRISNANLSSMPFWTGAAFDALISQGDVSRIQSIELVCSSLTEPISKGIFSVLSHPSFPAVASVCFSIKVDITWKKGKVCEDIVRFIVDAARWLTEVKIVTHDLSNWKDAIQTYERPGFLENVIKAFNYQPEASGSLREAEVGTFKI
ncbi:hypothetical protein BGZ96_009738 [Linnemannia gamsii]|uniref:RRM domain-containing protein n=1 Tax=Linnemannia gamsii TaxID=64522 RepID=A0ABQ7JWI5_9FUNG|nr:hypothetical protein BGZ96_009738 [Linnemannia gamsii]